MPSARCAAHAARQNANVKLLTRAPRTWRIHMHADYRWRPFLRWLHAHSVCCDTDSAKSRCFEAWHNADVRPQFANRGAIFLRGSMTEIERLKHLKLALRIVGVIAIFGFYPLTV